MYNKVIISSLVAVILLITLYAEHTGAFILRRESSLNRGLRLSHGIDTRREQLQQHRSNKMTNRHLPQPMWYTQKVDHYDPLNTDTFQQQYFVNATYWKPGGPVFLLLGGEGPASYTGVTGHFIINTYAQMFDALIVSVEHRFYGKSMPKPTLDTKHLKYLTTQQALADYAQFRNFIAQKYNTGSSKWVSFGGSYSGSLSAWFRLKYPQLIDAAIATSAPVQPQLDFKEYLEVVSASIGPQCSARIANVTNVVTAMLNTDRRKVEKLFNTCDEIHSDDDVATFFENLADSVAEIVQYNNDNNRYTMFNISKMCSMLEAGDDLTSFVNFNNEFNTFSGNNCTQSSYKSLVNQLQDVDPNGEFASSRTWTWQTCIEYGYFQTAQSPNQPFSPTITLDWFLQQCLDIFGPRDDGLPYLPQTKYIESDYGGRNIQTSQTIFPNGLVDPWHALGVLNATSSEIQTILITGTAHCADLYPALPTDPPGLVQARQMEVDLISSILP
ncbi:hypothetical protein SAMD00019534_117060 [Acytostelium subglobosum LB1]|uniref:hypothetical protein n=1 Tax=Acytostelium subglobosum LB1 TaxID=1410327 RepID=UPI0006451845|nr:hypothetical protein SAMD00019534_117060 [Acytostelium subglobosum LB1]GAM28530.1 hypothetical protein SAMD00019534_117060 [Acytostelium subglobosum LB1]|eukprot:XP_012748569.1 hypothetical protein SAMD00019534_117060 [Acytostelium subglobosum LB1]